MTEVSLEHMENRRAKLEASNNRSYIELQQKVHQLDPRAKFSMDTGDMRRELFYAKLVDWGIVTQQQALEFEIAFHEKVEAALNAEWEQVREAEKGRALTVVKNRTGLVDGHGRPLM